MGKRLDQLDLGDSGPESRDDLAIARRAAEKFALKLQQMADEDRYQFCWGMLTDMRLTVERSGRVTDAQREAIHNVEVGAQRHEDQRGGWDRHERRTGRRYEGFWND